MGGRILALLRARLEAQGSGALAPVAALLMQALVAAVLCGLVRDVVGGFAYALVALSISGALVAVPLLGELAALLDGDETGDWVRALPVRPRELHLARLLHLLLALGALVLGSMVPAAVLAPAGFGAGARLLLVGLGLGQALALAAALLVLRRLLGARAQGLLVLVQTALFVLVLVGGALGPRKVPALVGLQGPTAGELELGAWPPAWFAAAFASTALPSPWALAAPLLVLAAIALLLAVPPPQRPLPRRGQPLLGRLLAPARALARRVWVRPAERATFELVYDGLPREREFVLRTYPLVAVPLAFLLAGARGEETAAREGLLALLLFVPGAYLPILLAHVPGTDSAGARWLLDSAPTERAALDAGAFKALAVRFILPLYLLLALLCWSQGGLELAVRLALPAFLVSVLILRAIWRVVVLDLPLSVPADELYVNLDWLGLMGGLGLGLTLLSVLAVKTIQTPVQALAVAAVLLTLAWLGDRHRR